jgi:ferredoxin
VSPPTEEECLSLGPSLVQDGVRLACQMLPLDDIEIEVVNLAPSSAWRTIPS